MDRKTISQSSLTFKRTFLWSPTILTYFIEHKDCGLKSILQSQNPDIFNTRLCLTLWSSSQYSLQSKLYLKAHKPHERQLLKWSKLLFCHKKMPYSLTVFWYSCVKEWGHYKGHSIRHLNFLYADLLTGYNIHSANHKSHQAQTQIQLR